MNVIDQQNQFNQWMTQHGPIIHHVVNGFATGGGRDDLRQEVMLAVWKSIPSFRGESKASTFIYRVSHNAALLWTRKEKNYRRRIEQFSELHPEESTADVDGRSDGRLACLYAAIHTLKPVDRSLTLMFLDGLTYREMAEVLGLSECNVGVKLNRIKTHLTQTLKGKDHEPE